MLPRREVRISALYTSFVNIRVHGHVSGVFQFGGWPQLEQAVKPLAAHLPEEMDHLYRLLVFRYFGARGVKNGSVDYA